MLLVNADSDEVPVIPSIFSTANLIFHGFPPGFGQFMSVSSISIIATYYKCWCCLLSQCAACQWHIIFSLTQLEAMP